MFKMGNEVFKDGKGLIIQEGDRIKTKYDKVAYRVVKENGKLFADNGGRKFPLNSENVKLKTYFKED